MIYTPTTTDGIQSKSALNLLQIITLASPMHSEDKLCSIPDDWVKKGTGTLK
jgi:hypothetical protein